jgi:hypothetical protein
MKLEVIKLKEHPIDIHASFDTLGGTTSPTASSNRLQCLESSFTSDVPNNRVSCHGTLIGYNTLESFQTVDKNTLLKDYFCQRFFDNTTTVESLTSFMLLTFPDLKGHKVLYWFGFPVLLTKTPIVATTTTINNSSLWWQRLAGGIQNYRRQHDRLPAFFVFRKDVRGKNIATTLNPNYMKELNIAESTDVEDDVVFAFVDPTTTATTSDDDNTNVPVMGWPMRNLVAYLVLHLHLGGKTVQILSLRPGPNGGILRGRLEKLSDEESQNDVVVSTADVESLAKFSVLTDVTLPQAIDYDYSTETSNDKKPLYKVVGWELNARQKPGPRWVSLRPLLDQNHLAVQAADLNLKLSKLEKNIPISLS